ncbi:hypothetical protein [Streptomyces sp. NPDC050422]
MRTGKCGTCIRRAPNLKELVERQEVGTIAPFTDPLELNPQPQQN